MDKKRRLIKLIQKRVANIAIGPSSMRQQGPHGTIQNTRDFLAKLNLHAFKNISENNFNRLLNSYTKQLMKRFPRKARNNWGGARKAMNVFLEAAFYDRILASTYKLYRLKDFLELPLDSNVIKGLKQNTNNGIIPTWRGIKNLKREDSELLQDIAKKLAKRRGISRIHLDLYFWRA